MGRSTGLDPAELRAWLVELRTALLPASFACYVRTLRVLGTGWLPVLGDGFVLVLAG